MNSGLLVDPVATTRPAWVGAAPIGQTWRDRVESVLASTPGAQSFEMPSLAAPASIELSFAKPNFDVSLGTVEVDFPRRDQRIVIAAAGLDPNAMLRITIAGSIVGEDQFKPQEVILGLDARGDDARTHFIGSTFTALLGLSVADLRIPEIGLNLKGLNFDLPLRHISEELVTRQTAYKLMVIGRTIGIRFDFPPKLTGEEVQNITFVYRAIMDRVFEWPTAKYPLRALATEVELERLKGLRQPASMTFVRDEVSQELLGTLVRLGVIKVLFERAIIEDRDALLSDLALLDGHEAASMIRPLDGRARIECPEAPKLPPDPWTPMEQMFIGIGPDLCDILAGRYNALAAATLEGLSEEEKSEVTARPELDDDAHLVSETE